ncbi:MAG: hypothetical protein E7270_07925 [Lachnospiraceae bacterium]|nr:hypothetical protein [Lachnospiraceae bacterium]
MIGRKVKKLLVLTIMTVVMLGVQAPSSVEAARYDGDVSKKSYTCDNSKYEYYFTGTTKDNNITVDCNTGTVRINLTNVTIDMLEDNDKKSEAKPAIRIKKGTDAIIYLYGNNTLEGGNKSGVGKNYGFAGIQVDDGASVTILGNGTLNAVGGGDDYGAAGIGSRYDENCGKIIIGSNTYKPTITATGGDGGAGIGSGEDGICDDGIYIINGSITATGKNGGAGIGGGDAIAAGSGGKADTIVIRGGTVNATGGSGAAGIGGGEPGSSGDGGNLSNITISGGVITAKGGSSGAGIGGSKDGVAKNINIIGGTITATGGKYAAGIGAGNAVGAGDGGIIDGLKITAGTITATGGESAAGIGGGDQSEVKNFKIEQDKGSRLTITAKGGENGAGIGNGNSGATSTNISSLYIKLDGGTITATGGKYGAGIGGGNCEAKKIEIYGKGTINATGYEHSCAIGAGKKEDGGDIIIEGTKDRGLTINGYTKKDRGSNDAAVIGGADSNGGDISIKNAKLYLTSTIGTRGTAIGGGANKSLIGYSIGKIEIENCYVQDRTRADRFAASIGSAQTSGLESITIKNSECKVGSIGSTDNGNQALRDMYVDFITIEDSDIEAKAENGQRAGIGSGRYAGIKKITIKNSNVVASAENGAGIGSGGYSFSSGAELIKWHGRECGEIEITNSNITANGANGGAGIGGGWGTPVGDVTIKNSTITATGGSINDQGGAGIGGGHGESCGNIKIENSTITATGGENAAGIGSAGDDSITAVMWNTTCNEIVISGSNITAKGGKNGAGIGTGMGAQFSNYAYISIEDSTVDSTGGENGAGIGAGANGYMGAGGEACDIRLKGKSRVTATGGKGAAGIGGGYEGGAEDIDITLKDTVYSNGDWKYYVKATGGKGAAGIGSGGVGLAIDVSGLQVVQAGNDIDSVYISGGYVYAKGGDDEYGAGAGIGGGASGGNIKSFYVSGGYVEAHAGYGKGDAAADDIGTGGEDSRGSKDKDFKITGGTVIGSLSSDPKSIIIDGGSVSHNTSKAKRSDGTKVYKTTMCVEDCYYELKSLKTNLSTYMNKDIFSDGSGKVYLYLPLSGDNKSTADFEKKHYYGTTNAKGDGWMKMDNKLEFEKINKEQLVGDTYILKLEDANLKGNVKFSVIGKSVEIVEGSNTIKTSPGAQVEIRAKKIGEYTIKATYDNLQSDLYWSVDAEYTDIISREKGKISIKQNLTKVYDGEEVENPSVDTNSSGIVTYKYFKDDKYLGKGVKPKNAGNYKVVACVSQTSVCTAAESEPMEFEITKRIINLGMTAIEDGTDAVVTVEVFGAIDDPGEVIISVDGGKSTIVDVVQTADGKYKASKTFENISADVYTVTASYPNTANSNYMTTRDEQRSFDKTKAERLLYVDDIETTYGAINTVTEFNLTTSDGGTGICTYEVVYDFDNIHSNLKETIKVSDSGEITYLNAGIAVVKITMTDTMYNDAVAYATITVKRKPVTVAAYAYKEGSLEELSSVEYGSIDETIKYGLTYSGLLAGEMLEDASIGTLEPVPLQEYADAGTQYIAIKKVGEKITFNGKEYEDVFISRNYKINFVPGQIVVEPREIAINVSDITSNYGIKPELSATIEGENQLAASDSLSDVVESIDFISGKSYEDFAPGSYVDAITVTLKNNPNYTVTNINKGDLNIEKASLNIETKVESKVYDTKAIDVESYVIPITSDGISLEIIEKPSEIVERYYEMGADSKFKELDTAPKDAGIYIVEASVAENAYYKGVTVQSYFRIDKAHYDIDAPKLSDMKMREGLRLEAQKLPEGWEWINKDRELIVAPISAYAIYTPEDTRNYYKAVKRLTFEVYDDSIDDTTDEEPESDVDDETEENTTEENKDSIDNIANTSDDNNVEDLMSILFVALLALIGGFWLKKYNKGMKGE